MLKYCVDHFILCSIFTVSPCGGLFSYFHFTVDNQRIREVKESLEEEKQFVTPETKAFI